MKSEAKRRIIVCPPLETSILKVLRQLKGGDFRWVYLGEDVSKALALEKQLRDIGQRIEIAEELQKIAHSLRQPYIDYIGKLSLENNSLSWWVSSLSEKNPFVSKTFLHICYVKLCQAILGSNNENCLVFVVENKALRECLVKNMLNSLNWQVQIVESRSATICQTLKFMFHLVVNKGYFIVSRISHLLLARYYGFNRIPSGKRRDGKGLVLIHTWVDQRSFDTNGEYRESYFGELAHHLRNKGKSVVLVPYILGTVSYRQTLKKMAQSKESFLVPQAFLKISDIISVFGKTVSNIPRKRAYPRFEGIEVSELITNDFEKDWSRMVATSNLLFINVVKRWKNAGIPIDTFIHTYENHKWEKAYCIALRKFYPLANIIGYQHVAVPKMFLNYFFSKDELPILPFPDRVITNGEYPEKLFKESGYPRDKVVCGGAIRYSHMLNKGKNKAVKKGTSRPVVLVTPSVDRNEAIELVWKVSNAFEYLNRYRIMLKCHPSMPYHHIAKDLGTLPKHFIVSDNPPGELLRNSNVLLYTSSTTCIEALSTGVPVVHVESDFMIDRDPLDFHHDIIRSARNTDGIIKAVEEILKTDEAELLKQMVIWERVVSEMFGPAGENVLDLFL